MVQRIYQKLGANGIQRVVGNVVFWIGMVLTISGLCILLFNLLRH